MANLDTTPIRKRIREVLDDGRGLIRVVSAGRVSGDYWVGSEPYEGMIRALEKPRFDIPTISITPNSPGEFEMCNEKHYDLRIVLECQYALPIAIDTDAERDAVRSTAENDSDVFRQALGWPANMEFTELGVPTNIRSGGLVFVSFAPFVEDWKQQILKTRHIYTGIVSVVAATS